MHGLPDHARLRLRCAEILDRWANGRGRVGVDWRFYFIGRSGSFRSVRTDVAYVSFDRMASDAQSAAERPTIAPDIAIEILSPDRAAHVRETIDLHLECGTAHVVVIDPTLRSLTYHSGPAGGERTFYPNEIASICDGLRFDLATLFAPPTSEAPHAAE
ncbi:MAG: hypothetical protein NVSMB5_18540 [Candidatus Velthaea sp.]